MLKNEKTFSWFFSSGFMGGGGRNNKKKIKNNFFFLFNFLTIGALFLVFSKGPKLP